MSLLDLVAVVLATSATLDAWENGALFDSLRAYMRQRADGRIGPQPVPEGVVAIYPRWATWLDRWLPRFFAEAWSCMFCASYHAPAYLIALFYVPSLWLVAPWDTLWRLPIYSLAATRLVTWLRNTKEAYDT